MTEKIRLNTAEMPCHLYNMSRFLSEQLCNYTDALSIWDGFDQFYFSYSIRCILLLSNEEEEENEIFTFDKNNKIKVIISREKIAQKISESNNYMKEAELHKYKVDLINPAIDIKIGLNLITNKLYGCYVLICEDYVKYERENKSFGSILSGESYKSFKYTEEDSLITEKIEEFLREAKNINKISEILKNNKYFNYTDESDFYENCEMLLLSKTHIKKIKKLKEASLPEEDNYEVNIKHQNIDNASVNGSVYSDYDNCCVEDCRQLISEMKSLSENYATDVKKEIECKEDLFYSHQTNLLDDSFMLTSSVAKALFKNLATQSDKCNEFKENLKKPSSKQERDTPFSIIDTNEIEDILKNVLTKPNTSIDLRTNNSSDESGKKVEGHEELIGEEHLFNLNIKKEYSYNNLNGQTISNTSVNLGKDQLANSVRTAAINDFILKFESRLKSINKNNFELFEIHRNACMRKGYIKHEMKQ